MSEARCASCGGPILHEVGRAPAGSTTCPRCSTAVPPAGPETASVAEAIAGLSSTVGLDPYRTGTIVLESEVADAPGPAEELPVEVKVKGFLTQEGLPPDEADFRLRGGVTVVGRREGQILVEDPSVSGRHFQIEERGGSFHLKDLGSSNGTFLNDRAVRAAPLQSGDRIQAGSTVFTFSIRHTILT